jgi:PAS domain-containing protein
MSLTLPLAEILADARVAALLVAPAPVWLFDAEGKPLFANPAGLALIGAERLVEASARAEAIRPFVEAAQRISEAPTMSATPRLERLRLRGLLQPALFACSRTQFGERPALLFVGTEPSRNKPATLEAAIRALIGEEPFALFKEDGALLQANAAARALLGPAQTAAEIEAGAATAFAAARASGTAKAALDQTKISFCRIGTEAEPAMLALFSPLRQEPEPVTTAAAESGLSAPKTPTRFVWQIDAGGRFVSVSDELAAVVGSANATIEGLDWPEAATRLGIDGIEEVSAAIARHDTWSGVIVHWPCAEQGMAHSVELAALPVFDRARQFQGYRGFGVFRERIERSAPRPAPEPPVLVPRSEKVVPLRTVPAFNPARPGLSASERTAFSEIARQLGAHIEEPEPRGDFGKRAAREEGSAATVQESERRAAESAAQGERALLDRLPLAIVVHRAGRVLYANRTALDWIGLADVETLEAQGGLVRLFAGMPSPDAAGAGETSSALAVRAKDGEPVPVEARLLSVPW